MKKIIFLVFICFIQNLSAQTKGSFEVGLQTGINFSSVSDYYGSSDLGYGFNVGASGDYYFSDMWSIKFKFLYDQKGYDNGYITDLETAEDFETDFDLHYLTIPVMANFHFGTKRNWYVNFGLYAGVLLYATDSRFNDDLTTQYITNDYGLAFGGGVKIPVNDKLKFFIEFENQSGFTDIYKRNDYDPVTNSRSSINIGLNFLLELPKKDRSHIISPD